MEWIIIWYGIGLVGTYVGRKRAMTRMGSRFPELYDDPVDCWKEEVSSLAGLVMMGVISLLGPFSLAVILLATWFHERGLK